MTTKLTTRRIWVGLAPLYLLLLAGCGNTEAKLPAKAEEAPKPIAVSLVTAEERSVPSTLDVTGTLMADAQTDIALATAIAATLLVSPRAGSDATSAAWRWAI